MSGVLKKECCGGRVQPIRAKTKKAALCPNISSSYRYAQSCLGMSNYWPILLVLLSSVWLGGCASQPLETQSLADKRIGFVSLLGDDLQYQDLGTLIFSLKVGKAATPGLDMDGEVASLLERRLGTDARYTTINLQGTAPRLIKPYEGDGRAVRSYTFDVEKSKADLQWLKSNTDIDYLLVVSPDYLYNQYKRPQDLFNYGYYCSRFLGSKDSAVYLVARLTLVDMSTLETAARYNHFSQSKGDRLCVEKTYAEFDEKDRGYVDRALEDLIAETLPISLVAMHILPGEPLSTKKAECRNSGVPGVLLGAIGVAIQEGRCTSSGSEKRVTRK